MPRQAFNSTLHRLVLRSFQLTYIPDFRSRGFTFVSGKNILRLCSLHIYISAEKPLNIKSSDEVTIEAAKSIEIKSEQALNIQCKNANIKTEKVN